MYCPKCGTPNQDHAKFCERCGDILDTGVLVSATSMSTPYAGFWLRFVAYVIDSLVFIIPNFILQSVMGNAASLVSLIIEWLYFALMESSANQATLGKMALGLKVTDANGNRISFGRATGRYFAKFVSAIILGIGFMMAGWNKEKRALHDFMAGTFVVKKAQ